MTISLITITLLVIGFMTFGFVIALLVQRNDLADVWWGLGFTGIAITSLLLGDTYHWTQYVITALVVVWGLRLALHIGVRFLRHTDEDARYAQWRKEWQKKSPWYVHARSWGQVFVLQGLLMLIVMTPVVLYNVSSSVAFSPFIIIGLVIWIVGFFFEVVGDWQLQKFLSSGEKGIMQSGLWQYTRHPNYFGEVTMWWGIWIMTLAMSWSWIGMIGPLVISILILYVSGIPMTEAQYIKNRSYKKYQSTVNAFIPLKPFR